MSERFSQGHSFTLIINTGIPLFKSPHSLDSLQGLHLVVNRSGEREATKVGSTPHHIYFLFVVLKYQNMFSSCCFLNFPLLDFTQ